MSTDPMNTTPQPTTEEVAAPMTPAPDSDVESNDFSVSSDEMSDSDGDDGADETAPPVVAAKVVKTKTKGVAKAPRKAPKEKKEKKEKTVKVKKPRTIRRPYKSMDQAKLVTKQAIASGRFEVVSKRMISTQNQLERFNYEIAVRKGAPQEENNEEAPGVVCDDA
ncbi:hypothetical protein T484DRAFT_1756149 [Baffinella frigidus]|nr:hypothetical protein T484DRAFT_1756149 [Cryptophyta sp. CCMP2293]